MSLSRRRTAIVVAAMLSAATAPTALATARVPKILEVNVQRDPNWRGGEPEIAVNPRNADNMVMVWAAMKQIHDSVTGTAYPGLAAQFLSPLTGMGTIGCGMAYTFNGGKDWYPAPFPMRDKPACGDPMVVADSKGFVITFDLMGSPLTPSTEGTQPVDQVAVSRSTDGGRSWSQPVDVGTIVDRPFFRIDPSTEWLYEASGGLLSASTRKVTISKDGGKTWSPPVAFPGAHMAVNHGTLVYAAQVGSPAILTFCTTTNQGSTFTATPVAGATHGGTGDLVSADPSRPGRFAVMQEVGDVIEVFTTTDAGRTWSKPMRITVSGRTVSLSWLDFGPQGDLAVMWKSGDKVSSTFLVYSAMATKGGTTFSKPVQVSSAPSKTGDMLAEGAGDDLSWLTVDRDSVLIGWGDRRSDVLQAWFAKVSFKAYR